VHVKPTEAACKLEVLDDRENITLDDYLRSEATAGEELFNDNRDFFNQVQAGHDFCFYIV